MKAKIIAPITFIIGLAAGVVTGMLFAPHKGKVTRGKIKQSIEERKEDFEEKAMAAKAKAKLSHKASEKE
jgi:gas vesicle protein